MRTLGVGSVRHWAIRGRPLFSLLLAVVLVSAVSVTSAIAVPPTDNACQGLTGFPDGSLAKTTVPAGGTEAAPTEITVGTTVTVNVTWNTADWTPAAPDGDLDRVADCVEVGGVVDTTLSTEEKPTDNDGSFTHQYVIPNVAVGTKICDRARLSGDAAGQNEDTQKSNILCFTVIATPTGKATAEANKTVAGTDAPSLTPGWTLELKQGGTPVSSLTSDALPGSNQTFMCPPTSTGDGASGASCSFTVLPNPLTADKVFSCSFENKRDLEIKDCCIVVNNDGQLIVEKQTVPDGATQTFSFSGAALGTSGALLSDGQTAARTVGPGTYTIGEAATAGWDLTSITCTDSSTGGAASSGDVASATATFRVDPNETVRCVFTNTEEIDDGRIVVVKQTIPNGSDEEFGFAGALSGDISDGESLSATVEPGTYTVAEHAADGWELADISCTDSDANGVGSSSKLSERSATFNVDPGETVTCEFTNSEIEVLPKPPIVRTPPEEEPKVLPKGPVLPFTGGDPGALLTAAGILIAVGGGLTLGGRGRRRRH